MAYEAIKKWFPQKETNMMGHFISGLMAVTFSQIFSYPFNVVKRKMEAQEVLKGKYSGSVWINTTHKIY